MKRAFLPLSIALVLAGCGGGEPADDMAGMNELQRAALEQRPPDREKVWADNWNSVFTRPDAVIAAAKDMGYEVGPYSEGSESWSTGYSPEQTFPREPGPVKVVTAFRAVGDAADNITAITFTFSVSGDMSDPKAATAVATPRRIVGGFLGRFEIDVGDKVASALRNYESVEATRYGGQFNVDVAPGATEDEKRVIVTITRAPAPDAED